MRGSRVFYVSAYLFLFVNCVFFQLVGFISPPAGVQDQFGNMGTWAKGVGYQTRLFGFRVTIVFRGYAVDEWDGSPDTLWAATNCREKRGEVTAHGHGLLGYRQDSGLFGLITCQNTSDCVVNVMCQVKVGGAVMFLCCWSLGMRPDSCL
jgi:hypothetical protein